MPRRNSFILIVIASKIIRIVSIKSIAVFVSGEGTNLQALINAGLPISEVVADRECPAVRRGTFPVRAYAAEMSIDTDLIVLAGFMTILPPSFVRRFRIINIHPSLLPEFPGANAIRDALLAGVRFSGCTVHYVTEHVDAGPIIAQSRVPILAGDTEKSLRERIQAEEHRLLPAVVRSLL